MEKKRQYDTDKYQLGQRKQDGAAWNSLHRRLEIKKAGQIEINIQIDTIIDIDKNLNRKIEIQINGR